MKRILIIGILFLMLLPKIASGYTIEISFHKMPNVVCMLGYYYGAKTFVIDTALLDDKGKGKFSSTNRLHEGIYFLIIDEKAYVELLIGDDQEFSIEAFNEIPSTMHIEGSSESNGYLDYQKSVLFNENKAEKNIPEVVAIQDSLIERYRGSWLSIYLTALKPPKLPKSEKFDKNFPDALTWKNSLHAMQLHYFDNFDFSDDRFLYSQILDKKLRHYFMRVIPQKSDSLILYIDKVIDKTNLNAEFLQYFQSLLLEMYPSDLAYSLWPVHIYVVDRFSENNTIPYFLLEKANYMKSLLPGMAMPRLKLVNNRDKIVDSQDLKSKNLILFFFEPGCPYCDNSIANLTSFFDKSNIDFKVFAIYTGLSQAIFNEIQLDNSKNWVVGFDKYRSNNVVDRFQISHVPVMYLIDANKKIIGRYTNANELIKYLSSLKP